MPRGGSIDVYHNNIRMPKEKMRKSKSKFSNKYSVRIESIREADKKARIKTEKEMAKNKRKNVTQKSAQKTNIESPKRNTRAKKTPEQLREEMLKQLENSIYMNDKDKR